MGVFSALFSHVKQRISVSPTLQNSSTFVPHSVNLVSILKWHDNKNKKNFILIFITSINIIASCVLYLPKDSPHMFQCISYKNEVICIPTTTVVTPQQKMSWWVFLARTTWCDTAGEKMSEWVFQGQQQWHCSQKISWWVFLARTTMCVLAERKKNWQVSIPRTRAVTLLQTNVLTTDSPELSERNKAFVCDVATVAQLQKLQGVLHKRQVFYGIIIQVTAVMQDYASHMFQTTCTKKENSFFTMHAVHVYCFGTRTTECSGISCMPHLFPHKLSMWPSWWYYVALWKARWTESDFDIQINVICFSWLMLQSLVISSGGNWNVISSLTWSYYFTFSKACSHVTLDRPTKYKTCNIFRRGSAKSSNTNKSCGQMPKSTINWSGWHWHH